MIDALAGAKAKVIGYTVFFSEPENRRVNETIARLLEVTDGAVQSAATAGTAVPPETARLHEMLKTAEQDFNTDRKLAGSMADAGNVVLPVLFFGDIPRGRPDKPLPEFLRRNAVKLQGVQDNLPEQTSAVDISIVEPIGRAAALDQAQAHQPADARAAASRCSRCATWSSALRRARPRCSGASSPAKCARSTT